MDPLANPIWYALSGPQLSVAQGGSLARRFDPELSAFTALPDDPTPEAWDALTELVGAGNLALLFQPFAELHRAGARSSAGSVCRWSGTATAERSNRCTPSPREGTSRRSRCSVPTTPPTCSTWSNERSPVPSSRTHELGTYVGVHDPDDGRLLALAGQRLRPPGHVEISAVCTDPETQGRGLARLLVAWLIDDDTSSGDVPILHVAAHNTGAAPPLSGHGLRGHARDALRSLRGSRRVGRSNVGADRTEASDQATG